MLDSHCLAHRGRLPETVHRRSKVWRPAAAARNRRLREARESARRALRPAPRGASLHASAEAMPQTEARTRSPKTATVERREASVLRYWTRGASQAPGMRRHRIPNGCVAPHPCAFRRSAHPSGMGPKSQPGRRRAAGTSGLFEIVMREYPTRAALDSLAEPLPRSYVDTNGDVAAERLRRWCDHDQVGDAGCTRTFSFVVVVIFGGRVTAVPVPPTPHRRREFFTNIVIVFISPRFASTRAPPFARPCARALKTRLARCAMRVRVPPNEGSGDCSSWRASGETPKVQVRFLSFPPTARIAQW
jgi:hypothetical protein